MCGDNKAIWSTELLEVDMHLGLRKYLFSFMENGKIKIKWIGKENIKE